MPVVITARPEAGVASPMAVTAKPAASVAAADRANDAAAVRVSSSTVQVGR